MENQTNLPEKWAIRITTENAAMLTKWIESRKDFNTKLDLCLIYHIGCFVVSDGYEDMSYQYWGNDFYRIKKRGYQLITDDIFQEQVLNNNNMEQSQTIKREHLKILHKNVCLDWQSKINKLLEESDLFSSTIAVPNKLLKQAYKEADRDQIDLLNEFFTKPKSFEPFELTIKIENIKQAHFMFRLMNHIPMATQKVQEIADKFGPDQKKIFENIAIENPLAMIGYKTILDKCK